MSALRAQKKCFAALPHRDLRRLALIYGNDATLRDVQDAAQYERGARHLERAARAFEWDARVSGYLLGRAWALRERAADVIRARRDSLRSSSRAA